MNETVLDRLQGLLQKQLDLVRQGNVAAAMELCDQTTECVQWIAGPGAADPTEGLLQGGPPPDAPGRADRTSTILACAGASPALRQQGPVESWQCIDRLYQELWLALTAQRTEVSAALSAIGRGKRALNVYKSILSLL
jgi:hypothetical protein